MFISGVNREQMQVTSLESSVNEDNVVRFVDAFLEKLELEQLNSQVVNCKKEGRSAFDRKVLLKLQFMVI
jgi:hypothetical protein